jgi:HK97 family phage portal protein
MLGNFSKNETRSISYQQIWGAGGDFIGTTESGVQIDESNALKLNAFYACVLLISDTISTLPVDCFIRRDGDRYPFRPQPAWVAKPDVELLRSEHYQQVLVSLLLDGNAFIRIFRDSNGDIANLVVLDPLRVEVKRFNENREIYYVVNEDYSRPIPKNEMLHITEIRKAGEVRGVSRVSELRDNLGLAVALQNFASRFFAQGATTAGVIESPNNLTAEQAKSLADGYNLQHKGYQKAHKVGILSGGARFNRTGVNPDEAQMLDSQKFAVEQIARIFRVPPHMIGITTAGSMSYNSVEQQNINFVQHTLRSYIAKLEEAYSELLPQGAFLRFNIDGLLRGDFQTRMQGYSIGSQAGFLSINDIRKLEDLRPVEGGDVYRVPLANVDIAASSLAETKQKVEMAQKLINSGFDPASVLASLALPPMQHTGVPTVQLQNIAQIDPENPENVYDVQRTHDVTVNIPETVVNVPPAIINVEPPIVNVEAPAQRATIRTVERDADGRIVNIVERVEE